MLTKKLQYCGNLKSSMKQKNKDEKSLSQINMSKNTLVPCYLNSSRINVHKEEQRIPSPIKNKLEERSHLKKYIDTVKSNNYLILDERINQEEDVKKDPEFDTTLITNTPKLITLIDKLQILS